jgi:hypothetical protein
MQVSRDYINFETLDEYPVEERFLKLPVGNFLALREVVPIAPQIALINAINNPQHRFVVACLSRRTGKTYISNTLAFLKALEPKAKILIVSPNFSLTNISWNEQVLMLKDFEIEIESKNKAIREIHLENGSMIKFGSYNNPDSLVGHSYDLILVDEAALENNGASVFNVQLRPTLDKANSKCIFISTPRGLNYFYDFYQRGFSDNYPNWVSIHSTYRDNPRTVGNDIIDARNSMSKAEFKQEYEADFATFEGQIYEGFDEEKHTRDLSDMAWEENSYKYENIMGIDPGYKDHTGALVIVYDTEADHFYIVWDYQENERTTKQHAFAFSEAFDDWDVDIVFCDPASAQFRQDLAAMYDLPSNKANKSVLDGISYVQGLFENDKVTVDESCINVILMLANYRWDPNPSLINPKPKHDQFSHLGDALRYALYSYVI